MRLSGWVRSATAAAGLCAALAWLGLPGPELFGQVFPPNAQSIAGPSVPRAWMSPEKKQKLVRRLPKVPDARLQAILTAPDLLLYTEKEMPPAYQQWDGGLQGLHAVSYNISANRDEPHGNGNREFPWGAPAGTHRTRHVETFRFLWLPTHANHRLPVVWQKKRMKGDRVAGYVWRFPIGTVFGEVLGLRSPKGRVVTFEIRFRRRERTEWAVNVFRPFLSPKQLAGRIKALRPGWRDLPPLKRLVQQLDAGPALKKGTLRNRHPRVVFQQTMGVDTLPSLEDDDLVVELLSTTGFQSAVGSLWRVDQEGRATAAPTTKARFHIVPRNYDAGYVEVDRSSCMRCHETVGRRVTSFEFYRDWYGRIRGSDGIFSFHPFSLKSISHNGIERKIKMRAALVDAGWLEEYDPAKHAKSSYSVIPGLDN